MTEHWVAFSMVWTSLEGMFGRWVYSLCMKKCQISKLKLKIYGPWPIILVENSICAHGVTLQRPGHVDSFGTVSTE
jgi:hypothetical protein